MDFGGPIFRVPAPQVALRQLPHHSDWSMVITAAACAVAILGFSWACASFEKSRALRKSSSATKQKPLRRIADSKNADSAMREKAHTTPDTPNAVEAERIYSRSLLLQHRSVADGPNEILDTGMPQCHRVMNEAGVSATRSGRWIEVMDISQLQDLPPPTQNMQLLIQGRGCSIRIYVNALQHRYQVYHRHTELKSIQWKAGKGWQLQSAWWQVQQLTINMLHRNQDCCFAKPEYLHTE